MMRCFHRLDWSIHLSFFFFSKSFQLILHTPSIQLLLESQLVFFFSIVRSYKRGKKIENGRKQEYGKEKGKLKMLDRRQFGNGASA